MSLSKFISNVPTKLICSIFVGKICFRSLSSIFIPILLTEKMLPTTKESFIRFKKSLCIPDQREKNTHIALSAIHRYPQNSFLIIEIAKICFFRKMFHVANMIISSLFASNPQHVVARSLRMQIFLNLALELGGIV